MLSELQISLHLPFISVTTCPRSSTCRSATNLHVLTRFFRVRENVKCDQERRGMREEFFLLLRLDLLFSSHPVYEPPRDIFTNIQGHQPHLPPALSTNPGTVLTARCRARPSARIAFRVYASYVCVALCVCHARLSATPMTLGLAHHLDLVHSAR